MKKGVLSSVAAVAYSLSSGENSEVSQSIPIGILRDLRIFTEQLLSFKSVKIRFLRGNQIFYNPVNFKGANWILTVVLYHTYPR